MRIAYLLSVTSALAQPRPSKDLGALSKPSIKQDLAPWRVGFQTKEHIEAQDMLRLFFKLIRDIKECEMTVVLSFTETGYKEMQCENFPLLLLIIC